MRTITSVNRKDAARAAIIAMNFSHLLQQREALLRQARLANLAYAHARLSRLAGRIVRAGLRGTVTLQEPDPAEGRYCPALLALEGSQAVIEEHFLDEDVIELEEILMFLADEGLEVDYTFALEELPIRTLPELRRRLDEAGVIPPADSPRTEDSNRGPG